MASASARAAAAASASVAATSARSASSRSSSGESVGPSAARAATSSSPGVAGSARTRQSGPTMPAAQPGAPTTGVATERSAATAGPAARAGPARATSRARKRNRGEDARMYAIVRSERPRAMSRSRANPVRELAHRLGPVHSRARRTLMTSRRRDRRRGRGSRRRSVAVRPASDRALALAALDLERDLLGPVDELVHRLEAELDGHGEIADRVLELLRADALGEGVEPLALLALGLVLADPALDGLRDALGRAGAPSGGCRRRSRRPRSCRRCARRRPGSCARRP